MTTEAAGARAAELEYLGGAVRRPFAGFERQDEVVAELFKAYFEEGLDIGDVVVAGGLVDHVLVERFHAVRGIGNVERLRLTVGQEDQVATGGVARRRVGVLIGKDAGRRKQPSAPDHADVVIRAARGDQTVDIGIIVGLRPYLQLACRCRAGRPGAGRRLPRPARRCGASARRVSVKAWLGVTTSTRSAPATAWPRSPVATRLSGSGMPGR